MRFVFLHILVVVVVSSSTPQWKSSDGNVYTLKQHPTEEKLFPTSSPRDNFAFYLTRLEERCEVCLSWVSLALLELEDEFNYIELIGALTGSCMSNPITNYTRHSLSQTSTNTLRKLPFSKDESDVCYDILDTIGEAVSILIWTEWSTYSTGVLPWRACRLLSSCI